MMTRVSRTGFLVALTAVFAAEAVEAQVFTPTYMAPRSSSDVGVYLSDGPGEFAVEGIWRRPSGGYDLGFRVGVADTDDVSLLAAAELRNPIIVGEPIDLAVTGAIQGLFGDVSGGGLLLGLSVGHTFSTPEFAFTPYLHPRAGVLLPLPDGADAEFELLADFGFDVDVSQRLSLRLGVGFDGPWGVGLAWR